METFWERIADLLILSIKVLASIVVLRIILFFVGFEFHAPYIDDFWHWFRSLV